MRDSSGTQLCNWITLLNYILLYTGIHLETVIATTSDLLKTKNTNVCQRLLLQSKLWIFVVIIKILLQRTIFSEELEQYLKMNDGGNRSKVHEYLRMKKTWCKCITVKNYRWDGI